MQTVYLLLQVLLLMGCIGAKGKCIESQYCAKASGNFDLPRMTTDLAQNGSFLFFKDFFPVGRHFSPQRTQRSTEFFFSVYLCALCVFLYCIEM